MGCHPISELRENDPEIYSVIQRELERQRTTLQLIASENYSSVETIAASGSVLTNKYAEGYTGKRWYQGCKVVGEAESLAIGRANFG